MRSRESWGLGFVLAGLVALSVAWSPAGAPADAPADAKDRHSGTILKVDVPGRMVVVEELGLAGVRRELRVRVAPDARIVMSERVDDTTATDPPFRDTPIELQALRPGDFIVVESAPVEGAQLARAVTVTFRAPGADARR